MSFVKKYQNLQDSGTRNSLGKRVYLAAVKNKDELLYECEFDSEADNPYRIFETYEQATHPPKKTEAKYTYIGPKVTKDPSGIEFSEMTELPMKKFMSVGNDSKIVMTYMLLQFVDELVAYYKAHDYTFPPQDTLEESIVSFVKNNFSNPIAPTVFAAPRLFGCNYENVIERDINTVEIAKKLEPVFKNQYDKPPSRIVADLTEVFMRFVDVIGILLSDYGFAAQRAASTIPAMVGIIYIINTVMKANDVIHIRRPFVDDLIGYVELNRPKTEKKSKKKDDDGSDDDDSSSDSGKKKKPAKKASVKKPSKKTAAKKPAADEDDFDVDYTAGSSTNNANYEIDE